MFKISIMIEKLTPAQEKKLLEYRDKWIKIGLSTERVDFNVAKKISDFYYTKIANKKPVPVVIMRSPLETWLAVCLLCSNSNQVKNQVWNQVRNQVGDQVGDQVKNQVKNQVWDQVYNQVSNQVWDFTYPYLDGHWFSGYFSFYDYMFEVLKIKNPVPEKWEWYKSTSQIDLMYPLENICVFSDKPAKINLNNSGQLHSETEMAISYKDGWGIYALNGVRFNKKLWEKIVARKMSFKEVSEIKDIDQRVQAMAYCPPDQFLKEKGQLIDKSKRGNELYLIPKEVKLFTTDAYFLFYQDTSTGRKYMSGIDPEIGKSKNADECMAWKHNWSLQEYQALKIES